MSSSANMVFPTLQGDQVPAESRPILEKVQKGFGFIPNLFAAFSNSPILLEGYLGLDAIYSRGTLSEIVQSRGHVAAATIQLFLNAGFRNDQVGEVLIGVALKTISNYTNHLSPVEIDSAFKAEA